jgi:hypothetical protein
MACTTAARQYAHSVWTFVEEWLPLLPAPIPAQLTSTVLLKWFKLCFIRIGGPPHTRAHALQLSSCGLPHRLPSNSVICAGLADGSSEFRAWGLSYRQPVTPYYPAMTFITLTLAFTADLVCHTDTAFSCQQPLSH